MERLRHKIVTILISLGLGSMLTFYVHSRQQGSTMNESMRVNAVTSKTVQNVPIHVVDTSDKKYVSGLPETVSVVLEGPRNLLTQLNEQTLYVKTEDVREANGEKSVALSIESLPNGVSGEVVPNVVTAQIADRVTVEKEVDVKLSENLVASGYEAGTPIVSPNKVSITGAKETIDDIAFVTTTLTSITPVSDTIVQKNNTIVVTNKNNELLNVNVSGSITVTVPVYRKGQPVPVDVTLAGKKEGYTYRIISQSVQELTLLGNAEALGGVSKITATVNVSDLEESGTSEATILIPIGVTISNPQPIHVTVEVTKEP